MKDKFVIVTGASTGIGRATAVEFGKEGATVGLVARRIAELNKTKEMVEKAGGKAEIFQADLSNLTSTEELIKSIKAKTNKVDVLVNIAGIWHGKDEVYAGKDFESFDTKVITDTFNVGVVAPSLLAHGLIPLMPTGGFIINLSGTFENGAKGWLPYYVSKRAIEDLTIGLSQEVFDKGILVNCVSPSDVATEEYKKYFPEDAKNALAPEEVAKFIVKLCEWKITETGKVWVLKKGHEPVEKFHA